ncbi:cytochrome P450 [Colletotrichum sp. SAR11_57]|nr:cytochrome P450 [Colletotrichum sp. SAR11_57]
MKDKKIARQKLFANLNVLVKNAEAQLEVKRQGAQRAKEELNENQADYDAARAERDLFDPSAETQGTRTRRSGLDIRGQGVSLHISALL